VDEKRRARYTARPGETVLVLYEAVEAGSGQLGNQDVGKVCRTANFYLPVSIHQLQPAKVGESV